MGASGRISLLIDSPLRDLVLTLRQVPAETRKQIQRQTKKHVEPIWFAETRERGSTRLQQRVLVNSARVGVTGRNVFLRSGGVGKLASGTPVEKLAVATEFGRPNEAPIQTKSRTGKSYKRRTGAAFGPRRRQGNVVYPAAKASISRIASLWVQTAIRTFYESLEKA